jgi:autophagy-related protein 9
MAELVLHTHYLPRHWRGRAHSAEVQQALNSMFSFKLLLFLEELASVLLTPFILAYSLPRCAGEACRVCTEDHSSRSQFTT